MNVQHSSRSDRWFTPPAIVERVREVLGTIDFDPASEPGANELVGAGYYLQDDGLAAKWPSHCSVYLNPPGGKVGNQSHAGLFWRRLMQYRSDGELTHAIFMAFSIGALQNTQRRGTPALGDFPLCIPAKRICFVSPLGTEPHPTHSNAIVYVPGKLDKTETFVQVFRQLGSVLVPATVRAA